ncbi:DUF29 family protein [uncultured Thiohalocapsa sp.]
MQETCADAVELAAEERRLGQDTFPASCPYTSEQVLDRIFLPN